MQLPVVLHQKLKNHEALERFTSLGEKGRHSLFMENTLKKKEFQKLKPLKQDQ